MTPGSTAHSGSSATPTSGSVSQCSYAWTSGRKSARPGWMLSSSCPLTARAASRYSRTVESLQRLRYMPSGPGLGCTVVAMSSRTGTIGRIDGNSRICRWSRPTATERSPVIRPSAGEPGAPQNPTSRFFSSALGAGTVRVVGTAAEVLRLVSQGAGPADFRTHNGRPRRGKSVALARPAVGHDTRGAVVRVRTVSFVCPRRQDRPAGAVERVLDRDLRTGNVDVVAANRG